MKRLLVTGPTHGLERYAAAARAAGWEALEHPLIRVEPRLSELDALLEPAFDVVAITSANALPALDGHLDRLGTTPFAAVGPRTAQALGELGLEVRFETEGTARDLARALLAELRPEARVLWPRGELARDLGRLLRAGGLEVVEAVVYATLPASPGPLPPAEAIFLASPSATRTLTARELPRELIAIGPTTAAALAELTGGAPCAVLPAPTPEALRAHLEAGP